MHDIVIRGGKIVDGTGRSAFTGDVAIDGDRITGAGCKRLVQRVDGYAATIVAGTSVFENGEDMGARPGRLVRA